MLMSPRPRPAGILPPALSGRRGLILVGVLFAALAAWGWIGFLGSDDVIYARGAEGWLASFPYVGGHGSIRYPITVPMAASFLLLGRNEFAFVLPSLLYLTATLVVCYRIVARGAAGDAATIGLLFLVTMPLMVIHATIANIDVVELFWLMLSLALFLRALGEPERPWLLFGSGAAAGVAFLTRETAIFIAAFYGVLFLRGYLIGRARYLLIAVGFVAVWTLELLYLGVMTGDPLYRFNISYNHDSTIDRSVDLAGNVLVHPAVDPVLVLLFNQEFTALFWVGVPAAAWLCLARSVEPATRRTARLLALFGVVWFVCAGAAVTLLPLNPRYFIVPAVMAALLIGIAGYELWHHGHRRLVLLSAAGLLALNGVGILAENRQPMFAARELARAAAAHPSRQVRTDPVTHFRAQLLLEWGDADKRVQGAPPRPGDLFLHNNASGAGPTSRPAVPVPGAYEPRAGWRLVEERRAERDPFVRLIEASGLEAVLPASIRAKLRGRDRVVRLYLVE